MQGQPSLVRTTRMCRPYPARLGGATFDFCRVGNIHVPQLKGSTWIPAMLSVEGCRIDMDTARYSLS